jgi:two-component system chemotaxis response regulator CheB
MPNRKIIVIGGSAGSGKFLREILTALPANLEAAIFVAVHRTLVGGVDYLPVSLERIATFRVGLASDGDRIETGRVYVAPAEGHLLVGRDAIRTEQTTERSVRDNIDALFISAAMSHSKTVIGVLLSGMLSDGTAGFWQIRKRGGVTISQDPKEAQYAAMPQKRDEKCSSRFLSSRFGNRSQAPGACAIAQSAAGL